MTSTDRAIVETDPIAFVSNLALNANTRGYAHLHDVPRKYKPTKRIVQIRDLHEIVSGTAARLFGSCFKSMKIRQSNKHTIS